MTRLHIISGEPGKSRSEAELLKDMDSDLDWVILDAFNPDGLAGLLRSRNVIWVVRLPAEVVVTSAHHVVLPTTFGSNILASLVAGGPRQRFVAAPNVVGILSWMGSDGETYDGSQLVEPVVSFVAEEA